MIRIRIQLKSGWEGYADVSRLWFERSETFQSLP